jgi:hypothetical protein
VRVKTFNKTMLYSYGPEKFYNLLTHMKHVKTLGYEFTAVGSFLPAVVWAHIRCR